MLSNRAAVWLFIVTTVVLFGVIPPFDQQLVVSWDYWNYIFDFLFPFWFITFNILAWSYAIILYMLDRHNWFVPYFIGMIYIFLTKEARVVAKDFYKFNFFKGDEK